MRIWDLEPEKLCWNHLLGEHRELHALWTILTQNKKGYSKHPETQRWIGKLKALYLRHEILVQEMSRRGYNHKTPLEEIKAVGEDTQASFINTYEEQVEIIKNKACDCKL
ncbi:MAG TPA: pyrimidine dimer DNA glycosylase/endonuclease V [Candidatus Nitrosocosmicus sp.]|nr:pyrimidine dimer DNA glycosylase/endonuclease V [Candidatus Nitrosocosmicus sp.]